MLAACTSAASLSPKLLKTSVASTKRKAISAGHCRVSSTNRFSGDAGMAPIFHPPRNLSADCRRLQYAHKVEAPVCNLYSMTKSREATVAYTRAMRDRTGNEPPLPAIFPDQLAPVVRKDREGVREMLNMRWGFPPPAA